MLSLQNIIRHCITKVFNSWHRLVGYIKKSITVLKYQESKNNSSNYCAEDISSTLENKYGFSLYPINTLIAFTLSNPFQNKQIDTLLQQSTTLYENIMQNDYITTNNYDISEVTSKVQLVLSSIYTINKSYNNETLQKVQSSIISLLEHFNMYLGTIQTNIQHKQTQIDTITLNKYQDILCGMCDTLTNFDHETIIKIKELHVGGSKFNE